MHTIPLLQSLSATGQKLQSLEDVGNHASIVATTKHLTITTAHIQELAELETASEGEQIWNQLSKLGVSLSDVSKTLAAVMSSAPPAKASQFAAWYMALLKTPGCPVMGLFDRITCAAYLKTVRDTHSSLNPTKTSKKKQLSEEEQLFQPASHDNNNNDDDDAMDVDNNNEAPSQSQKTGGCTSTQQAVADIQCFISAARDFATLLASCISFKDQPDLARSTAEAFSDVGRSAVLNQEALDVVYEVLLALISPAHGGVREMGAVVLRLLGPHLMGQTLGKSAGKSSGGGGKGQTAVRSRALAFIAAALQNHAACAEAAAALTRHIMLRCPDKADARTHSVDSIATLCSLLSTQERQQVVVFIARLSKTSKVTHRLMAVEVASALLSHSTTSNIVSFEVQQQEEGEERAVVPAVAALRKGGSVHTPSTAGKSSLATSAMAPTGVVCLAVLVQRSADKAPAVRAKALAQLAATISSHTTSAKTGTETVVFCKVLNSAAKLDLSPQPLNSTSTPMSMGAPAAASPASTEGGVTPMTVDGGADSTNTPAGGLLNTGGSKLSVSVGKFSGFAMPAGDGASSDVSSLLSSLRRRCGDDRGLVRKGAVTALQALLVLQATTGSHNGSPDHRDIDVLEAASGDVLVSVRKAAAVAIHSLIKALPNDSAVARAWVGSVLPLIRDVEASVQETICDQVDDVLTGPAAASSGTSRDGNPTPNALAALSTLTAPLAALGNSGAAGRACLSRSLIKLKEKNRLKTKQAVSGLERFLGTDQVTGNNSKNVEAGAWLLYAELAQHDPAAPAWTFLQSQWNRCCGNSTTATTDDAQHVQEQHAAQLLRVIAAAAGGFPPDQATPLCNQLLTALRGMNLGPSAAAAHVAALASLSVTSGSANDTWQNVVLNECEQVLGKYVDSFRRGEPLQARSAQTGLFTAGEVAMLRSRGVNPSQRLVTLVQALTSSTLASSGALSFNQQQPVSDTAAADEDNGAAVSGAVPAAVQAHAWVALGKLCLVDERLAKKCIPLFVQELGRAGPPAVRNNIMVALADLVVHYTALVDAHVGRLADCIRDSNELVRTQAVALLANLLQKDYVKWRGPLFHRFLLALVDDSPKVVALAEFLLGDALATKLPNMAYNRFMEVLFVLNDCHVGLHGGSAAAAHAEVMGEDRLLSQTVVASQGGGSRDVFTLKGSSVEMRAKRDALYKALLIRMPPEHKFATAARLCQEVLGAAADGSLPLEESSCEEVIGDALRILCSPHIKVSAGKAGGTAAAFDVADGEVDAAAVAGAAKGKLVSQMMRKHLVESVVPIIAELKQVMEAARHPLVANLMSAAAALLKEYKGELEDILAGNKQLAREILYDIKRAEEAAKESEKKEAATIVGTAPRTATTPAAVTKTPGQQQPSAGKRKSVGFFPPGTSGNTPIAVQVLAAAGAGSLNSPLLVGRSSGCVGGGSSAQQLANNDGAMNTPGGARPMSAPRVSSGVSTPGSGLLAAADSSRRRALLVQTGGQKTTTMSRLARASGPGGGNTGGRAGVEASTVARQNGTATSADAQMLEAGMMSPMAPHSVPKLRKTPGSAVATRSRLGSKAITGVSTDDMEEENQVNLPFGVPGTAEKRWNVSNVVVNVEDDGGIEVMEEDVVEKKVVDEGRVTRTRAQRKRKA